MRKLQLLIAAILLGGIGVGLSCSRDEAAKNKQPRGQKTGDVYVNPKDGAEMVWVQTGEFLMGSNDGPDNSRPQRKVYLDGYWIYRHEVTVAQYRKFCEQTGRNMPNAPSWGWEDKHPMVHVTWEDAADYAKWAGVSLPTEAQWEKAARGTDARRYPWGNKWDPSKCNLNSEWEESPKRTQPVGSYPTGASPYGCMDMAGNVWEWCADFYKADYYNESPSRNPAGPASGSAHAMRGGSWYELNDGGLFLGSFFCASRYVVDFSSYSNLDLGFRCVITP